MKRVIAKKAEKTIAANFIRDCRCVLVTKDDEVMGMIRKRGSGYVIAISCIGDLGYKNTIEECVIAGERYGYKFYVV